MKKISENQFARYFIIICLLIVNLFFIHLLLQLPFFNQIKIAVISTFIPFLISFAFVYTFHPLLYWIETRFSIKTWVTILVLITLYAIFIILSIEIIIPLFAIQFYDIITDFPKYIDQLEIIYNNLALKYTFLGSDDALKIKETITNTTINNFGKAVVDSLLKLIIFSFKSLWLIIIIPIIIFLLMVDYPKLRDRATNFLVKHRKSEWINLLNNIDIKLGLYMRGQLIVFIYMFIGTFIPLVVIRMPNAFVFSLIIALTNMIPYLGPFLGGIPLVIYAYFQTPILLTASLIVIIVMKLLDWKVGKPLIFKKRLNIHSIIIIIVTLVGAIIGGVVGLISSVPLYIIISEIYLFVKHKIKNPQN